METFIFSATCYIGRKKRSCYPFVLLAVTIIFLAYIETEEYNELKADLQLEDFYSNLCSDTYLLTWVKAFSLLCLILAPITEDTRITLSNLQLVYKGENKNLMYITLLSLN